MAALNIEQARRRCLDLSDEADRARLMGGKAQRISLHRCSVGLSQLADFLTQAQIVSASSGIAIDGDLVLADRLAAVQRRWNAGDWQGSWDALIEAHSHMKRTVGVETTEDVQ